jgi:hypothetical protein
VDRLIGDAALRAAIEAEAARRSEAAWSARAVAARLRDAYAAAATVTE